MLRSVPRSRSHTLPLFHSVIAISAVRRLFIPGHADFQRQKLLTAKLNLQRSNLFFMLLKGSTGKRRKEKEREFLHGFFSPPILIVLRTT